MFGSRASKILIPCFFTALFSTGSIAHATPAEVLIIRHGEKPATSNTDSDDQDLGQDLSARGYERAKALPRLFTTDPRFLDFGPPVAIYAGAPKDPSRNSKRPEETVIPTAQALGLSINLDYKSKEYGKMVDEVLSSKAYEGRTILISWPHDQIEEMTHLFGVKRKLIPTWSGKTFDRVWKIRFTEDGDVESFEDLPQSLLKGDSAE